jgi:uncharacterized membrane protein (UPF0127 family)
MKNITIFNQSNSDCLPITAKYCDTFMCRFRGLMLQKSISPDIGVLLVESGESKVNTSIHMLFMNFDIAAIWLNDDLQVVDTVLAKRWKLLYLPQTPASYILETHPSRMSTFQVGDQLRFDDA